MESLLFLALIFIFILLVFIILVLVFILTMRHTLRMSWRRADPRIMSFGNRVFGASPLVRGDPFIRWHDGILGTFGDFKSHMFHHGLSTLADLLVLLMLIVHLVLEVKLEAKGLLESNVELGKPILCLGEGKFIVRVFMFFLFVFSTKTIPRLLMMLDQGISNGVR
jgi:hypothetical protein